jgi:hypothetical protein
MCGQEAGQIEPLAREPDHQRSPSTNQLVRSLRH